MSIDKKSKRSSAKPKSRRIIDDDEDDNEQTVDQEPVKISQTKLGVKRKHEEVESKADHVKESNKKQFCDNFKPRSMQELLIDKKKITEFDRIMKSNWKIVIIWGPSGWGKNTLLETYWKENNYEIRRLGSANALSYNNSVNDGEYEDYSTAEFEKLADFMAETWLKPIHQPRNKKTNFESKFKKMKISHRGINKEKGNKVLQIIHEEDANQFKGNVGLIQSFPNWIKEFSKMKISRLERFNSLIRKIIENWNSGWLVFMFNDSKEWNKNFLSKYFTEDILQNEEWFKILKLNPITIFNVV